MPSLRQSDSEVPVIDKSMNIGRRLVWLGIVPVAALCLFTASQIMHSRTAILEGTKTQMARLDMVFAEQTGRALETVDFVLHSAGDAYQLTLNDPNPEQDRASLQDILGRRTASVQQVLGVMIVDPEGHVVATAGQGIGDVLPAAGGPMLAAVLAHPEGGLQISEPFKLDTGKWTALMGRAIRGPDGHTSGMAVAFLKLSYFEDFYKAVELNENGSIILHRRDGTVLARYPRNEPTIGQSYAELPPFKEILTRDVAGTLLMDSPIDGSRRILAIRALRLFPIAVNISVGEEEVLEEWRRQTWILGIAAAAAILAIGALLIALARRSRQAHALLQETAAARAIAEAANDKLVQQMEERERAERALREVQRLEAAGQLTRGVAHDFNNLLAVIMGNIDLLERSALHDPSALGRLATMRAATERGSRLTRQMLAFSRRQPLQPRPVDLNELIRGLRDLLRTALGGRVEIDLRLEENLWPALVDPTQVELAILNLAINGRDAMPGGGSLMIETGTVVIGEKEAVGGPRPGDYVTIAVRDTGEGMSEGVLARAFEPFFTTKEVGKGSGLGLSQVHGFVHQSGGSVRIDSSPNNGTVVTMLLPRASALPQPAASSTLGSGVTAGATRVLVVDDDHAVRSVTMAVLTELGYSVSEANNGEIALELLRADPGIGVLLTDVVMPGMTGPELALRARELRPLLPVVFISGYADPEALTGHGGFPHLVSKPFRPSDLASQIEAARAGGPPTRPTLQASLLEGVGR